MTEPGRPVDPDAPYVKLGGHDAVVRLVERFYTHMDTLPQAATIRALHDDDLSGDKHKLAAFLSGWLGGPPLYWQDYGHPRLRQRHGHLPVDTAAAEAWLACMTRALDDVCEDARLRAYLMERFTVVAHHIRNTPDHR